MPLLHEAYKIARAEAQRLEEESLWEQALEVDWWLYHNPIKTGTSQLDILFMAIEVKGHLRGLTETLFVEYANGATDCNLFLVENVYSGWEIISEASKDRTVSLLKILIICRKVKPEAGHTQRFFLALTTVEQFDMKILAMADTVLDLARLAVEDGFLEYAKIFAGFVWAETIVPWQNRQKIRSKEAGKLLMDILRRQEVSLLNDGHKFSAYLSNSESIQLAAQTSISTGVSASDIDEYKIPVELLVIRGFRTPLQ